MVRILAAILVAILAEFGWAGGLLHHELALSLDPVSRRLLVSDRIHVGRGREVDLRLAGHYQLEALLLDGRELAPERGEGERRGEWRLRVRAPADRTAILEVRYTGELDALDERLTHRQVLGIARPISGAEGAFLAAGGGWYPQSDHELVTYRLNVVVPAGFRAVAPGRLKGEARTEKGFEAIFETADPLPGIDLMAGPYSVSERLVQLASQRNVRVRTYFHKELESYAQAYLDSAAAYLARYDNAIGPYAFASYSIVSSPLPTGFGMPGIAYLGRQVLRLPFIRATSLGHEVLHDWWGNGVYPDYARGNWSEGLTSFLADYAFKEDEGEAQARAMRLGWLRDFAAVRPEHDRPLTAFVSRRHGADQAVGYNKAAFVFFMLRDLIGEERFRTGLRRFWSEHRFRYAAWDQLRGAFEASAERDLREFFAQWISRRGAPKLEVGFARRARSEGRQQLVLELRQTGMPYRLGVPLRVYLESGASHEQIIEISGARAQVSIDLPAQPRSVVIDPDVRIFRRLDPDEIAPILRQVMFDRRTELALASDERAVREAAAALASATLEHAPRAWAGNSRSPSAPLLIIGTHAAVARFLGAQGLPAVPEQLKDRGTGFAYAGRSRDGSAAYAVVSGRDAAALLDMARALPHLGAQSFALFDGARSIERGVWPVQSRHVLVTD